MPIWKISCAAITSAAKPSASAALSYDELVKRDKLNLDLFWPKDDSLKDIDNLPSPDVLANEITENLQAALEEFGSVSDELTTLTETTIA